MAFSVETAQAPLGDPGSLVATLTGELDMYDESILLDALREVIAARPRAVVLDLHRLSYIASKGIGQLIQFAREIRAEGGRVMLANLTPSVRNLLESVQMPAIIPIYPTVQKALAG